MKRFSLIAIAAGCGLMVHAQTNTTGTLSMPRGPTLISSASADFDLSGHEATYRGHVRVDDPQMKLACERLIANVPEADEHVNHIVAETNVVIDATDNKGQTHHATGDKAVYIYNVQNGVTNETVTLTGNPQPRVEDTQGIQVADVITWDRANNSFHFDGNYHMVFHQNFNGAMADTNSAATNPPPAKTNPPSGAVQYNDLPVR
jgi:lipopolysaccharide export system protein LptA